MFPSERDARLPPRRRTLGAALLDAADLLVAFVTLESYALADLRPTGPRRAPALQPSAAAPAALELEPPPAGRRTGSRSFVSHRAEHPRHRTRPVSARERRGGSVAARDQLCLAALPERTAPTPDPRWTPSHSTTSLDSRQ